MKEENEYTVGMISVITTVARMLLIVKKNIKKKGNDADVCPQLCNLLKKN